ncbi:MAG: BlaI/MecI/CopY family transcriptional regulator, partial [Oscillospiraceae bacterium]|nr:BlaI/MecI/CopY family transcriptional regulator [Oscillospiraceae bacterium]
NPPITTVQIMSELPDKNWKMPTLISLLNRLAARGLIKSEKTGRERLYYPLIGEDEYMNSEIKNVITKYKRPSVTGLVSALYDGKEISESDKEELLKWLQSKSE